MSKATRVHFKNGDAALCNKYKRESLSSKWEEVDCGNCKSAKARKKPPVTAPAPKNIDEEE